MPELNTVKHSYSQDACNELMLTAKWFSFPMTSLRVVNLTDIKIHYKRVSLYLVHALNFASYILFCSQDRWTVKSFMMKRFLKQLLKSLLIFIHLRCHYLSSQIFYGSRWTSKYKFSVVLFYEMLISMKRVCWTV